MMKFMAHLLIDGYNLLHFLDQNSDFALRPLKKILSLQDKREELMNRILHYQSQKAIEVSIVFDSSEKFFETPARSKFGRIVVIFSEPGENADLKIARMCQKSPSSYVVISNDLEVLASARLNRCLTMSCKEFSMKLKESMIRAQSSDFDESLGELEEDRPLYPRVSTKKKGASKKLPKRERQRKQKLKNL
ncbi:MAG: NYN domain-containing protein [Bdellovibrionota bacterium]|jgi:predicted RNA-binding protein with PIN domain